MSTLPRIPTAIVTAVALLATALVLGTDASAEPVKPKLTLQSRDQTSFVSMNPTISKDGRTTAFEVLESNSTGHIPSTIALQEADGKRFELPKDGNMAFKPWMSGDAKLVAFSGSKSNGNGGRAESQLYVVDRRQPAAPVLRQVTETPNDLPYQRILYCREEGERCGVVLSRDGKTLVAPIYQSTVNHALYLEDDDIDLNSGELALVDLGASPRPRTLTVRNDGFRTIAFPATGPTIEGDAGFSFTPVEKSCAGDLAVGASCTIGLTYSNADCAVEADATLRLPGATPNGQTALKLTAGGFCGGGGEVRAAPAAPDCTGQSEYKGELPTYARTPVSDLRRVHPLFALGHHDVGRTGMVALELTNPTNAAQVPRLASKGCQLRFVLPPGAPANACKPGQPLPVGATCTAFVEYLLPDVAPFSATFHVGSQVSRLAGYASRAGVALWRDPSGAGNFGTTGPPQLVSVDGSTNRPIDGSAPSVSADGRWVAFTSAAALGRASGDPTDPYNNRQVYVHDTDAQGNGTHQPGQTLLVSTRPDGKLPAYATDASISDDGSRIAFTGADPDPSNPEQDRAQVYLVDRASGRSILVSAGPDGAPGDRYSDDPALSGDGSTVSYVSRAGNLLAGAPAPLPGGRIFARDISADLAGKRGANDLVSVRPSGSGGENWDDAPAINHSGAYIAFDSDDRLDETADNDSSDDVYLAERGYALTMSPAVVDFGRVPVGSTSGRRVVALRNDGPGAYTPVKPVIYNEYGGTIDQFAIAADQCTGRVLHAGETCNYLITFKPTYVGKQSGELSLFRNGEREATSRVTGFGTSDVRTTGETRRASTDTDRHIDAAISDNGQFVAYRTRLYDVPQPPDEITVRDMAANTTRKIVENQGTVGPPAISGDGSRAAYNLTTGSDYERVRVGDKTVTETESDLEFQRPGVCETGFASQECRPSLSNDGRHIAFPARFDATAPGLSLVQPASESRPAYELSTLLDVYHGTQRIQLSTDRPVRFTEPPVVEGSPAYSVAASTCTGELAKGASCSIDVKYDMCASEQGAAVLKTRGATPDGQTAIRLVGDPRCFKAPRSGSDTAPGSPSGSGLQGAKACVPLKRPQYSPSESRETSNQGLPLADFGGLRLGGIQYRSLLVTNTDTVDAELHFGSTTGGCEFEMVTPVIPDQDFPACTAGGTVPAGKSCTATVAYRPEVVGPAVATMRLSMHNEFPVDYRFTGRGFQDVVVQRSDPAGNGEFASVPKIVSRTGSGQVMDGSQPSLSGDGRYVAFASTDAVGREPADDNPQVYRHDQTTGQTVLVSRKPDGTLDRIGAHSPSISRTGDRIAFQTKFYLGDGSSIDSQVFVRDLPTNKTILASPEKGSTTRLGNSSSYDPSLSDDGTTVAFGSRASNLVDAPGNSNSSVYVRYLEPDFTGTGQRFTERVALTEDGAVPEEGASGAPSINEDGAFTAFDSTSVLVKEADDFGMEDVYVRRRLGQLVVEPAQVDFGSARVGQQTGVRRMTVRNVGMGPVLAGPSGTALPFAPGTLRCTTKLYRGSACEIDASFKPVTPGRADGLLAVPSRQGYLPGPSTAAALTGAGTVEPPVARFAVTPSKLVFGPQKLGTSAGPGRLTIRNTGNVALAFSTRINSSQGDFGLDATACGTVMPGGSCVAEVSFAPRLAGQRTGSVVVNADAQEPTVRDPAAQTVGLAGVGIPPLGPTPVAAMTVVPKQLLFGPQILFSPSAVKQVIVTNTGTVPLSLTGRQVTTDFVADASRCGSLLPGRRCAITVRFVPQGLGVRPGALMVEAVAGGGQLADPFTVRVGLQGTTAVPKLTILPPVSQPGRVVVITGENFPLDRPVVLDWQTGIGDALTLANASGRFEKRMVIYKRDVLGPRILAATIPGHPTPILSKPLLVQALSPQPPTFLTRW